MSHRWLRTERIATWRLVLMLFNLPCGNLSDHGWLVRTLEAVKLRLSDAEWRVGWCVSDSLVPTEAIVWKGYSSRALEVDVWGEAFVEPGTLQLSRISGLFIEQVRLVMADGVESWRRLQLQIATLSTPVDDSGVERLVGADSAEEPPR